MSIMELILVFLVLAPFLLLVPSRAVRQQVFFLLKPPAAARTGQPVCGASEAGSVLSVIFGLALYVIPIMAVFSFLLAFANAFSAL